MIDYSLFCGDAQTTPDRGVERENILAVAVSACRKGKSIGEKSPVWLFYRHIWRILRPMRPFLLRVFGGKDRN